MLAGRDAQRASRQVPTLLTAQVRQAAAAAVRELLYFDALCGGDLAALQQSCAKLAAGMCRPYLHGHSYVRRIRGL
jgi:hypothetical protein